MFINKLEDFYKWVYMCILQDRVIHMYCEWLFCSGFYSEKLYFKLGVLYIAC